MRHMISIVPWSPSVEENRHRTSMLSHKRHNVYMISVLIFLFCTFRISYQHNYPDDCDVITGTNRHMVSTNGDSDNGDGNWVTCKLKTIDSTFGGSNLNLIPAHRTRSLRLICADILLHSTLTNTSFNHLRELKQLIIEQCKLTDIPAGVFSTLRQLRNLTIQTGVDEWSDQIIQLPSSLLRGLNQLQRIDLSRNSLQNIPRSFFCGLNSLKVINLTQNQFTEVNNLSFSYNHSAVVGDVQCSTLNSVEQLYLTNNRIRVLTVSSFLSLPKLRILSLKGNQISRAEENSLHGLRELVSLDLSGNQLVALPAGFFRPVVSKLTKLYLHVNSITVLPRALFTGLKNLTHLDLSHNAITSHWLTFDDLIELKQLDLSYNRLSIIGTKTFRSQRSLVILKLDHNEIESIGDAAFTTMVALRTLILSHNRLARLDSAAAFVGLSALNKLDLDHNNLTYIHRQVFRNISTLVELSLSYNTLQSIPPAINGLGELYRLNLSHNSIELISNSSFQGNAQLHNLDMSDNRIRRLTRDNFHELQSLSILNLASNRIESIENGTFDHVSELIALRLDSNRLEHVNELFGSLSNLLMLNISVNRLAWFDYAQIPQGLQWLDIHGNQLTKIGNVFVLENTLKLKTLDCSSNLLTEINSTSLPNGLEMALLNDNHIRTVEQYTFIGKQNLTRVNLSNNRLTSLQIDSFRLTSNVKRPLPEFSLANNPLLCDCHLEWLQRLPMLEETRQHPRIVDLDRLHCRMPFGKGEPLVKIMKANASRFLCSYTTHCFSVCHCCDFDACDCEMTCPDNCGCYYEKSWKRNVVDCSANQAANYGTVDRFRHRQMPRFAIEVTELFLDGNELVSLSSQNFIGRVKLQILHLNDSRIERIANGTFASLHSLQVLNLAGNELAVINGHEFESLSNLSELYLDHNRLTYLSNNTFTTLTSLEVLTLDHNLLVDFEVWQLSSNKNPNLWRVTLAGNRWSCECFFVTPLLEWMTNDRRLRITDSGDLRCWLSDMRSLALAGQFNMSTCTNFSARKLLAPALVSQDLVPMIAFGGGLLILLVLIMVVMLVFRREMSVWFFSRYGVRLNRGAVKKEEERLFDAFISYSKKDEPFVSQVLAAELEYGAPQFRVCLFYRDLPVSGGYLADAIVEAMEASQRTILVVTENFLRGEWCRYEFKSAHLDVLRSGLGRLVIIGVGKIDCKDIDPDLRFWMKTATFLQWGEKMFWEKLRYAMPDIAFTRKQPEQTRDFTVAVHI